MAKIIVKDTDITVLKINEADYISLTDIAKYKSEDPNATIANWIRNRNTIEFLGLWERLFNPDFKPLEFEGFRRNAGLNAFTLSPKKWMEATGAIGIIARSGRYGGTFAHKDIALKFANWISVEFEMYMLLEYQHFKADEKKDQSWTAKRELAKINYHIHTSAISHNLIPKTLTANQINYIYASEADVLNMAVFGITAKDWREHNPDLPGNMRDYAELNQLICLLNLENINSVLISDGIPQNERLEKLNQIAIQQMTVLEEKKLLTTNF